MRALMLLLPALGVGLVVWQLLSGDGPDTTTVSALLLIVIGLIGVAVPQSFIALGRRITHIEALGLKVELRVQEARLTVAQFDAEEDGAGKDPPSWPDSNKKAMELIADKLREKLRFSSTALFDRKGDEIAEEMIVLSLGTEGLLPYSEVRLCQDLLGDFYTEMGELDEDDRIAFLDSSWVFAARFASRIFDRQARKILEAAGWRVADFSQARGHRADFLAVRKEANVLMAARIAAPMSSLEKTANRLRKKEGFPLADLKRAIVVPDYVRKLPREIDKGPMRIGEGILVARLSRLAAQPGIFETDPNELPEMQFEAAQGDS
ncbi:MAG TPA: hypothetical protein VGK43_06935 [Solirubrobacterales bacterium]